MIAFHDAVEDFAEPPEGAIAPQIRFWDPAAQAWIAADEGLSVEAVACRHTNYVVCPNEPGTPLSPLAYFVYLM